MFKNYSNNRQNTLLSYAVCALSLGTVASAADTSILDAGLRCAGAAVISTGETLTGRQDFAGQPECFRVMVEPGEGVALELESGAGPFALLRAEAGICGQRIGAKAEVLDVTAGSALFGPGADEVLVCVGAVDPRETLSSFRLVTARMVPGSEPATKNDEDESEEYYVVDADGLTAPAPGPWTKSDEDESEEYYVVDADGLRTGPLGSNPQESPLTCSASEIGKTRYCADTISIDHQKVFRSSGGHTLGLNLRSAETLRIDLAGAESASESLRGYVLDDQGRRMASLGELSLLTLEAGRYFLKVEGEGGLLGAMVSRVDLGW